MGVDGSLAQRADELRALFGLTSVQPSEWDRNVLIAGDPEQASVTLYPTGEWYFANFPTYPQWSCPDVDGQAEPDCQTQVQPDSETSDERKNGEMSEPRGGIEPYECTPPPAARLPALR